MKKFWMTISICLMITFSLLGFVGCGEKTNITAITFEKQTYPICKGATATLHIELEPVNANLAKFEWSSSNNQIVSIETDFLGNQDGTIKANNYGRAFITITDKLTNISASCLVIVNDGDIYFIEPDESSMKTQYFVGEKFNPNGLIVTGYYESGVVKELLREEYEIIVPEILAKDSKVFVKYKNLKSQLNIIISEDYISSLRIDTPPTKTDYFVGEIFNPEGMTVSAIYASGKVEPLTNFSYSKQPLLYGQENVRIFTDKAETYFNITIKPNETINDISKLQEAINNAPANHSIMIASGLYQIGQPILIPKSKNITIFGEKETTTITSKQNEVFKIVNDIDDETQYRFTLANLTLQTLTPSSPIIGLGEKTSINNLNSMDLYFIKLNFTNTDKNSALNFIPKDEGFTNKTFNKLNIYLTNNISTNITENLFTLNKLKDSKVYYNINILENVPNLILKINNSSFTDINIDDNGITSNETMFSFNNISNFKLDLNTSKLISLKDIFAINNSFLGVIKVTKDVTLQGLNIFKLNESNDIQISIDTVKIKTLQSQEDILENEISIIYLTGCQNVTGEIKNSEFVMDYIIPESDPNYIYKNALCYALYIKDGIQDSANNVFSFIDTSFKPYKLEFESLYFKGAEKTPTSKFSVSFPSIGL